MLLKVAKVSKLNKKKWFFKYSNNDFDEIVNLIISNLDYDYIELLIWSAELYLFYDIEYDMLFDDGKFSTIKLDKANSIKILEPSIYEEIRFFEIQIFNVNERIFNISSDNYGEYTSITMKKTIDEEKLHQLLEYIFMKNNKK